MDYNIIFIAGPQGSGKGTQGKRLAEKTGFLFWEMGGTLRAILARGGPLAEKIRVIDHGTLLSDETIIEVLNDQMPLIPPQKGIIFDGVPRRLGQGQFIVEYWRGHGMDKMATLFIDVPREESMKRLLLRAQHESRMDDTPEAIAKRLDWSVKEMEPAIEYLKAETTFIAIDGTPAPDDVAASIDKALGL